MLSRLFLRRGVRIIGYILAFVVPILLVGGVSFLAAMTGAMNQLPAAQQRQLTTGNVPAFQPGKPIVAVLLADDLTEITDFLEPYDLLATAQHFNVYAVAPTRHLTTLMGGVDVLPHYGLADFDRAFPQGADLVVVPYMPTVTSHTNAPLLGWLQRQARQPHTTILSWCAGAMTLAQAGLLDGKPATTHWGDIDGLARQFPEVHWQRGVRYVDDGNIITSAGLTSGVDATLHVLTRYVDQSAINAVVTAIHYPTPTLADHPQVTQFTRQPADGIYLLNGAFGWGRPTLGLALYEGMDETALAATSDTYAGAYSATIVTVARQRQPLTTLHGLTLLPRQQLADLGADQLIVPGSPDEAAAAQAVAGKTPVTYLFDRGADAYAYAAAAQHLATMANVPTARFALKRLEYRGDVTLHGNGWPLALFVRPFIIGGAGVLALWGIQWLWRRRRMAASRATPPGETLPAREVADAVGV